MNVMPANTTAMTPRIVMAFWPGVKPSTKRRPCSFRRSTSTTGMSDLHPHDVLERTDRSVPHRDGELGGELRFGRGDRVVVHVDQVAGGGGLRQRVGAV